MDYEGRISYPLCVLDAAQAPEQYSNAFYLVVDRNMLGTMMDKFAGGPVGLETLSAMTGEDATTIEDVYEPFLLQQGFLTRTPRGRCVTRKAYDHLGIEYLGQQEIKL